MDLKRIYLTLSPKLTLAMVTYHPRKHNMYPNTMKQIRNVVFVLVVIFLSHQDPNLVHRITTYFTLSR